MSAALQAGDMARCVDIENWGRLCVLLEPYPGHGAPAWACRGLQTMSLHPMRGPHLPAIDYPAGCLFIAYEHDLRKFGGLDLGADTSEQDPVYEEEDRRA